MRIALCLVALGLLNLAVLVAPELTNLVSLRWFVPRTPDYASRQKAFEDCSRELGEPEFGSWRQVGPLDPMLATVTEPERSPSLESYLAADGHTLAWEERPEYVDGYVNLLRTGDVDLSANSVMPTFCLSRTIKSSRETEIDLFLGCETGLALWLNSELIYYNDRADGFHPGEDVVRLRLHMGTNRLVLKIRASLPFTRFFILPDFGGGQTEAMLIKLERRFPMDRSIVTGFREWAQTHAANVEDRFYPFQEVPVPSGIAMEGGGMDFLPDRRLAVSTRRGFVYLIDGLLSADPSKVRFHRFAEGLHEGFGLKVVSGNVLVVERGGLTRLIDTDGDGRADRFENLSSEWGLTGDYHEYAYGLEQDAAHNLYVALNLSHLYGALDERGSPVPYRGWILRVTPQGVTEPFCYGLRSPNGMGHNAQGDLFVTDNQGQWVPACPIYHIRKGKFFGHPASVRWAAGSAGTANLKNDPERTPPAVWLPYEELSQSATGIVCDETGGRFGPFEGQLFVGDMTKGTLIRVDLEKIGNTYQGACFLFRRNCGAINRMVFGPDARLYFTRVNRGWGGGGRGDGLARIEFSGQTPFEIKTVRIQSFGFELQLTKPVASDCDLCTDSFSVEEYGYHYWGRYGSPKTDLRALNATHVEFSADRRSIRLDLPPLRREHVCHVQMSGCRSADGEPLLHDEFFYTVNLVPPR